jgi:hypothetical protein
MGVSLVVDLSVREQVDLVFFISGQQPISMLLDNIGRHASGLLVHGGLFRVKISAL